MSWNLIYVECHLTQSSKRSLTIFRPNNPALPASKQNPRCSIHPPWCSPIPCSFLRLAPFVNASFNFSISFIENETAQNLHKNCVYPTCQFFLLFSLSFNSPNQTTTGERMDSDPNPINPLLPQVLRPGGLNVEPFPLGPLSAAAGGGDEI